MAYQVALLLVSRISRCLQIIVKCMDLRYRKIGHGSVYALDAIFLVSLCRLDSKWYAFSLMYDKSYAYPW